MIKYTALAKFITACNKAKNVVPYNGRILALDPGETTGYCCFDHDAINETIDMVECDQIPTWPERECATNLRILLDHVKPSEVIWESYRIYDWKSDDHKWSPVNTTQVIGCIWTHCHLRDLRTLTAQSAQNAKGFWTDDRLIEFGLYIKGLRHGRDAMRHALHFLCFGSKDQP
jgi:hypothetical protein